MVDAPPTYLVMLTLNFRRPGYAIFTCMGSQARIAGGLAGCFACPAAGPLRGWVEGRSPTRRRQSSRQGPRRGRFTAIGFRASSFLIPSELVRSRASSCHLGTPGVTPGLALCF